MTSGVINGGRSLLLAGSVYAGGNIDPLIYVDASYTVAQAIPDPNPAWGDIEGADAFDGGQLYALLWGNGNVIFYDESDDTIVDQITTANFAVGITELPSSYPGPVGILRSNGRLAFYDLSGNFISDRLVLAAGLRDISYDQQRDQILISNQVEIGVLQPDGTLVNFFNENPFGFELLDLAQNEFGDPIDDLFHSGPAFRRIDEDGNVSGFVTTKISPEYPVEWHIVGTKS